MRKISLFIVILCYFLCAISFRKVISFNSNAIERGYGFDTDHDGKENLIISGMINDDSLLVRFWEHAGYDRYVLEDTGLFSQIFGIGYLDNDSLVDMVGLRNGYGQLPTYVYESPGYNNNPTQIVWGDSGLPRQSISVYIADLDGDTLHEMLMSFFRDRIHTAIYETRGNNQYVLVWQDTIPNSHYFIWGDFDQDGKSDFFTGYPESYGMVVGWECVANDMYQMIFYDTLAENNNYDIFAGNDLDDNDKPELFFTCVNYPLRKLYLYAYETIGDNQFAYFPIDSTPFPFNTYIQLSTCGDIDSDGHDEIVWSNFNQWYIYKATGIHQYQRIYSSPWSNHGYTTVNVHDINKNGYPEIIESWDENGIPYTCGTVLWEIEGVRLHYPNGGELLHPGDSCLVRWEKCDPPGADSFGLFFSTDSGRTYDTVALGLSGSDTSCLWTVPDTISDSCLIMIWAYGPPRPGEQDPRGTAWDFSDSVFCLRPMSIQDKKSTDFSRFRCEIFPNPFMDNCIIEYAMPRAENVHLALYDVSGRLVKLLVNELMEAGVYHYTIKQNDLSQGIYFLRLTTNTNSAVRKLIRLKY